jgi:anti-sigma B factor antagonist
MADQPPIEMSLAQHGTWCVAHVRGDLDLATAPHLESSFEEPDGHVALDLAKVRFIDSTGLRALVRIRERQARVVLIAPSPVVQRLLSLTGMTDAFPVASSLAALDSME